MLSVKSNIKIMLSNTVLQLQSDTNNLPIDQI